MLRRFGKLYDFDEPPEAKEIVHFMRKATEPALHVSFNYMYSISPPPPPLCVLSLVAPIVHKRL